MGPTSIIRLLQNVPLSPDYADVLVFTSASDQLTYFSGKARYTFSEAMYVRPSQVLIPNQAGDYKICTYMMYQNPDIPGKWFYGFITDVTYVADGTTLVSFVEDFLQTWWFDMRLGSCLVRREHVQNDTPGANLKDEPVAIGDYIIQSDKTELFTSWAVILASAVSIDNVGIAASPDVMQGTLAGLGFYKFSLDSNGVAELRRVLDEFSEAGKSDAIVDMWSVPSFLIESSVPEGGQVNDDTINNTPQSITIMYPTSIDGYTPRNKKLLTYPYIGLEVTNNSGQNVLLRYEFFSGGCRFQYRGSPMPSGRVILTPLNYAGDSVNHQHAIAIGNYPHGSWTQDIYANWLATESINWNYEGERRQINANFAIDSQIRSGIKGILTGSAGGAASMAGGGPYAAIGGAIGGGLNSTINGVWNLVEQAITNEHIEELAQSAMAQEREVHSIIPPSAKGTIGNDTTQQAFRNIGFYFNGKCIKAEYAKSIDNFFDLFGYRVDVVKVPNLTTRKSWNYIQTIGAIVLGNAPLYAKDGLRQLLNRGIRFWHTPDIGNYELDNSPIRG